MSSNSAEDARRQNTQSCHEMDPIWKKEKKKKKNHLAEDSNEDMHLTRGEAQAKARDRSVWRSFVVALCQRRDEEDEWVIMSSPSSCVSCFD